MNVETKSILETACKTERIENAWERNATNIARDSITVVLYERVLLRSYYLIHARMLMMASSISDVFRNRGVCATRRATRLEDR